MALRVRVCALAELPADDDFRAFAVAGVTWPVIVARVGGELIATPGVCPHEDVSLANGWLDGEALVCPGHGYAFDLATGRCKHDGSLHLRRYAITLTDDALLVDLL